MNKDQSIIKSMCKLLDKKSSRELTKYLYCKNNRLYATNSYMLIYYNSQLELPNGWYDKDLNHVLIEADYPSCDYILYNPNHTWICNIVNDPTALQYIYNRTKKVMQENHFVENINIPLISYEQFQLLPLKGNTYSVYTELGKESSYVFKNDIITAAIMPMTRKIKDWDKTIEANKPYYSLVNPLLLRKF